MSWEKRGDRWHVWGGNKTIHSVSWAVHWVVPGPFISRTWDQSVLCSLAGVSPQVTCQIKSLEEAMKQRGSCWGSKPRLLLRFLPKWLLQRATRRKVRRNQASRWLTVEEAGWQLAPNHLHVASEWKGYLTADSMNVYLLSRSLRPSQLLGGDLCRTEFMVHLFGTHRKNPRRQQQLPAGPTQQCRISSVPYGAVMVSSPSSSSRMLGSGRWGARSCCRRRRCCRKQWQQHASLGSRDEKLTRTVTATGAQLLAGRLAKPANNLLLPAHGRKANLPDIRSRKRLLVKLARCGTGTTGTKSFFGAFTAANQLTGCGSSNFTRRATEVKSALSAAASSPPFIHTNLEPQRAWSGAALPLEAPERRRSAPRCVQVPGTFPHCNQDRVVLQQPQRS